MHVPTPPNSAAFVQLRDFITSCMRMAHVYQPVMLRVLIEADGHASARAIAAAFLSRDESQLEYYEQITKRMPGRVLASHGLVQRDGNGFRLLPDVSQLTPDEKAELIALCDRAEQTYLEHRGARLFDHRRAGLGDISGTDRYEVLARAGRRCELCGVSADERALEVDHMIPRKYGGSDDRSNLQALCYKCNANKGARDATDFRAVRVGMEATAAHSVALRTAPLLPRTRWR